MAEHGPVRGTIVIRPYGYALWERIQSFLDGRIKQTGHSNAYFPQLIPISFLRKEASHIAGFDPELAVVTRGGGKELEEPLALRPTSETMINHFLSRWIRSHRDLPLLLNQWANVHRWELRPRPFLRTLEFLWQEGHTAHAGADEARAHARVMLGVYRETIEGQGAICVVPGRKSNREKFAGAVETYTLEAMMRDGKALQAATSHFLGDNFARAFDTSYSDARGERVLVHQTSFGLSTRVIGGILLAHGDDAGARLPPCLAPVQVVVIPLLGKAAAGAPATRGSGQAEGGGPAAAAAAAAATLRAAGVRVEVDDDADHTPGFKFSRHEARGVPLRLELGPRDLASESCVLVRRGLEDGEGPAGLPGGHGPRKRAGVPLEPIALVAAVKEALEAVQGEMAARSRAFFEANVVDVASYQELRRAVADGKWARGPWAGSDEDESSVQSETAATLRCIPFDQPQHSGICFYTGKPAVEVALFAKAY